ncbi:MAG: pilin [bacterium]|nr:pilin [bacterium]
MYKVLSIKYWMRGKGIIKIRPVFFSFILFSTFCFLLLGAPALGAEPIKLTPNCNAALPPNTVPGGTPETTPCNVSAFIVWVKQIIKYMFIVSVPIATAFIVYGAFVMMKSGGNPGEFANGKKVVLSAIIGIVIMFTANIVVSTIVNALTGSSEYYKKL